MKELVMKYVRMSMVGLLGAITLILAFSEPIDEASFGKWFETLYVTKGLAFLIGYITYTLFKHWDEKGLLPDMDDEL